MSRRLPLPVGSPSLLTRVRLLSLPRRACSLMGSSVDPRPSQADLEPLHTFDLTARFSPDDKFSRHRVTARSFTTKPHDMLWFAKELTSPSALPPPDQEAFRRSPHAAPPASSLDGLRVAVACTSGGAPVGDVGRCNALTTGSGVCVDRWSCGMVTNGGSQLLGDGTAALSIGGRSAYQSERTSMGRMTLCAVRRTNAVGWTSPQRLRVSCR